MREGGEKRKGRKGERCESGDGESEDTAQEWEAKQDQEEAGNGG